MLVTVGVPPERRSRQTVTCGGAGEIPAMRGSADNPHRIPRRVTLPPGLNCPEGRNSDEQIREVMAISSRVKMVLKRLWCPVL